jgi:hypothetical protein
LVSGKISKKLYGESYAIKFLVIPGPFANYGGISAYFLYFEI